MIEAKITGDSKGVDHCMISIEEAYSEDGLLHLLAQLKELNDAVLDTMVEQGFDAKDVSFFAGAILLHTLTDFRKSHNISV